MTVPERYHFQLLPSLLFLISLLGAVHWDLKAQISGNVVNAESREPVIGANIVIKGTQRGTATDRAGRFTLTKVTLPVRLEISRIGYRQTTLRITQPTEDLIITLQPKALSGDAVTVRSQRIDASDPEQNPLPITVLTAEQLATKTTTNAVDLLRAEPGVFVQQTSVGQGSIYVRGRAGRDVLYLYNGLRLNPSFVRSGQNQYFGSIDPFSVSEMDIYRGPISVFYGSDALSGGVNVEPTVKPLRAGGGWGGSLLAQANVGGNGEKTANGNIYYQSDKLSLYLNGTARDYSFYRMSERSNNALWFPYDEMLSNADFNFYSYQASAQFRLSEQSSLTAVSFFSTTPNAPRLDRMVMGYAIEQENPPSAPRTAFFSNTSPMVFSAHSLRYRLATEILLFDAFQATVGFHRLRDDRKETDFQVPPNFQAGDDTFIPAEQSTFDNNTSNQWLAALDFSKALGDDLLLTYGGDAGYDYVQSNRTPVDPSANSLPRYPDGSKYIRGGLFTHLEYRLTEQLNAVAGSRFAVMRADIPFEGQSSQRGFDPFSQTYSNLTASLGLRYRLTDAIALSSNISNGFRAPNVADLSELGIRRSNQFQQANTNLKPEQTRNIDLGIRLNSSQVSLEIVGFWLHFFDNIQRIPTGRIVDEEGSFIRQGTQPAGAEELVEVISQNATSLDILGIESQLHVMLNPQLSVGNRFNYTWGQTTEVDGEKVPVDRIPPPNGLAYLAFNPTDGLTLRPELRYAFAHRRISPNEITDTRVSRFGTDGFANVRLGITWKVNDRFTCRLIGDNLTNSAYREHASSLDGMARNVTISLRRNF